MGLDRKWVRYIPMGIIALLISIVTGCNRGNKEWEEALDILEESDYVNEPAYAVRTPQGVDTLRYEEKPSASVIKKEIKKGPRHHDRIYVRPIGNLKLLFNDSNYIQYRYAEKLGISPIRSLDEAYNTRRPIVKIESCEDYEVDSLKYSLPYLVPEASRLLHKIGRNFKDSLAVRGADGYRIKVTSLLRTPHTVKRLRRVNVNATDSSTHQFGTTFDISWVKFHCLDTTRTIHEGDLKNLLGEVLQDLRLRGECLVIFERKTGCYHVTATR